MKQYCRYCSNCVYGDVVYCEELKKVMSEASAKTVNHCKHFEFNEIDALNGCLDKKYKPRTPKVIDDNQPSLFEDM